MVINVFGNEADVEGFIKEFDDWLKTHSILNNLTRWNYVCGVRKLISETSILDDIKNDNLISLRNTTTTWLFEKPREYSRKYHIMYLLKFLGKENYINELKDVFKQIKIQDRRYERYLSLPEWKMLIDNISHVAKQERERREESANQSGKSHLKPYPPHIELALPLLLQILYDTGARVELIKIKVRDIHKTDYGFLKYDLYGKKTKTEEELKDEMYYITFKTKGRKIFSRYIERDTYNKIQDYIKKLDKKPNDYLFTDSKTLNQKEFQKLYYTYWSILKNLSRKILNREYGISFHWTRTSRAKGLIQSGRNLIEIKTFLGHKNIETTMRYVEGGEYDSKDIIKVENKWR